MWLRASVKPTACIHSHSMSHNHNHRLNSNSTPVLMATRHSYENPRLCDFFWLTLEAINLHAKWLKRRGLRQGCAFCSKNRNFSYPLISRAPKGKNLEILWTFRKFSLDLAFNIRGHGENTPYSSPEPNECDIVNRQSGGETN